MIIATMNELVNRRVVVMGLGRFGGGVGVSRFLAEQGARVLVTDVLPEDQLADSIRQLEDVPVEFRLGEHRKDDFADADIVIVNPAVDPRNNPYIQAAKDADVQLTTEMSLLLDRVDRNRVIGITGTAGKSTTTAMVGYVLSNVLGNDRVHVGGNIGKSLLTELDRIKPDDWLVLELSSFMLEWLSGWSPHIAVATNLADNHLDRHDTLENYARIKQNILRWQTRSDIAILGRDLADWAEHTEAQITIVDTIDPALELRIPGDHNRINASTALAVCDAVGIDRSQATSIVNNYNGLPHRLQCVAERNGVMFFNDSKCTTPDAAMLAIDSFPDKSVHIILGGYDKHADLRPLARYAAQKCAAIYTIGVTGPAIADEADTVPDGCEVHRCQTLDIAVEKVALAAQDGEAVVLSPACASWDQFQNYESRGRAFGELVLRYATQE